MARRIMDGRPRPGKARHGEGKTRAAGNFPPLFYYPKYPKFPA